MVYSLLSYFVITILSSSVTDSFPQLWKSHYVSDRWTSTTHFELLRSKKDSDEIDSTEKFTSDHEMFSNLSHECIDSNVKQQMMDELEWRTAKVRLEESNEKSFLKRIRSKPWKLPYEESVRYAILVPGK